MDKYEIDNYYVLDDDPNARASCVDLLNTYNFQVIEENGPFTRVEEFTSKVKKRSCVICDYNLQQREYASFYGSEAVRDLYFMKIPSILCTRYVHTDLDEIRRYRRWIPVLAKISNLEDQEFIKESIKMCFKEFEGEFTDIRKPRKTMVVLDDSDLVKGIYSFIIKGWNSEEIVKLFHDDIPSIGERIKGGETRFWAKVNVGAEVPEDVFITDWE